MNAITKAISTGAMILASVSPALAAGAREDHSGIVVWAFLGFCALIVVAQLAPAIMMMIGMVKGVAKGHEAKDAEEAKVHSK